jgi:hypothetical protein
MDEQEKRARAFVRRVFAGATKSVTKEGAQQFFRAGIELKPIEELIEGAREGDPKALEVLRARGRALRGSGATAPREFHLFVWECFLDGYPKGRPGPKPYDHLTRDMIIAGMVKIIHEEFGFSATRNEASKDKSSIVSACQIVAEEAPKSLFLTEEVVEAIWKASAAKARMEAQQL